MIRTTELNPFMLLGKNPKSIVNELADDQKRVVAIECVFNNECNSSQVLQSDALDAQLNLARTLKKYIKSLCVEQKIEADSSELNNLECELLNALSYDEKVSWAMDITFHAFKHDELVFSNSSEYDDSAEEEESFPIILYKANEFSKGIKRLLNEEDTQSYEAISDCQDLFREYSFLLTYRLQEKNESIAKRLSLTVPPEQRSAVMRDARSTFDRNFCNQLEMAFVSQRDKEKPKIEATEKNRLFQPLPLINSAQLSEKETVYRFSL